MTLELLNHDADPMLLDHMAWTPLHYAARNHDHKFSELLLRYQADPRICDDDGWSPFHVAALCGNVNVMEILWRAAPSLIERKTNDGRTPLHFANCFSESTKWLLAHDVEVDAKAQSGATALMIAAQSGSDDVVGLLLSENSDPQLRDNSGQIVLHHAAEEGSVSVAQKIWDKHISIINHQDDKQESALHVAIRRRRPDLAKALLLRQPHIDVNLQDTNGNTPLLLAVNSGSKMHDHIELLIEAGADTELRNKVGQTALLLTVGDGNEKIWQLLLDTPNGSNIDAGGGTYPTALHLAAQEGESRTVAQLVDRGANVNAKGGLFHIALQAAAANGFDDVVEYLLGKGADASLKGGLFGNALNAAVYSGEFDIIPKLNDRGAAVNVEDDQGRTALHLAAWRGSWDTIEWLKIRGNDLNVKDHQGRTILHHAAMGGNTGVVERLLNDEATRHLNVEDTSGWTPLHWACRSEANKGVVRLLSPETDFRQPTHDKWTPENISVFHDAKGLLPIIDAAFAERNQSHITDNQSANRALPPAKKWKIGDYHWGVQCDGCTQKVS